MATAPTEIREARLADLVALRETPEDRDLEAELAKLPGIVPENVRTLVLSGRPAAVVGILPMWPGVARAFAILTPPARKHPLALHRMARDALAELDRRGYWRIEATVLEGHLAGHRWLRRLGFEREGRMRRYGEEGQDHHLYARIRD